MKRTCQIDETAVHFAGNLQQGVGNELGWGFVVRTEGKVERGWLNSIWHRWAQGRDL